MSDTRQFYINIDGLVLRLIRNVKNEWSFVIESETLGGPQVASGNAKQFGAWRRLLQEAEAFIDLVETRDLQRELGSR